MVNICHDLQRFVLIPDGAGFLNSRKHIKIKEHGVMVACGSFVAFFRDFVW